MSARLFLAIFNGFFGFFGFQKSLSDDLRQNNFNFINNFRPKNS